MSFNPDPTKQAQELIFSRKVQTTNPPPLFFNENVVPTNKTSVTTKAWFKSF